MTKPTNGRRWMLAVTVVFFAATTTGLAARVRQSPPQTSGAAQTPAESTSTQSPKNPSDTSTPGTTSGGAATTAKTVDPASGTGSAATTQSANKASNEQTPQQQPPAVSLGSRIAGWTALVVTTGILALFGCMTFLLVVRFTKALDARLALGTRSHWGGFGGGDSGWELTPALAVLLAAVVLAIATTALGSAVADAAARLLEGRPPASSAATAATPAAGAQKPSTPTQ
jgi:hypothetical protein